MLSSNKDTQANSQNSGTQGGSGLRCGAQDGRHQAGGQKHAVRSEHMTSSCCRQDQRFKKHPQTGEEVGCFGVFDGHGGPNAADFVRQNLFDSLLKNSKFTSDLGTALVESFVDTDQRYLQADAGTSRDDGCTAVTAVLHRKRLVVANVGDSRAVLSRNGQAVPLSEDHKPNRIDERQRIESAGGVVVWAGTWRVGGVLAVSRAFGDRLLKRYVVAMPDITEQELESHDEALILASDGLWDDAEKAAKKLTDEAYCRGSNDNISCIVVRFNF
eukprot:jgi/Astpho2/3136/Aster-03419